MQRHDGFDFLVAPQYAALELEVGEAVARLRRFCQAHDGLRVEGRLVAQRQPWVTRSLRRGPVCEIAPSPVADVEQVAEDRHALALPALAEQRRDRHAEMLAEQIEQCAFEAGDGMDGGAQIESLGAATDGVAVGEAALDRREQLARVADRSPGEKRLRFDDHLLDRGAAGHLADADVARRIADDDEVAREEGRVRAAQVEQHAVVSGDGNAAD